jgi:hypothetical protein
MISKIKTGESCGAHIVEEIITNCRKENIIINSKWTKLKI